MNPADQIERTIEKLHVNTKAETDERILNDAFAAFEKSAQKQSPRFGHSVRRRTLIIRLVKTAAIAAVILIVFALFFGIPARESISLNEICGAVTKVENICIATFEFNVKEPVRIEWISQSQNINMSRFAEQFVLWDIPNRVKMTKNLSSDSVKTEKLSEDVISKFKKAASPTFSLVPFSDVSNVSGAQWSRVKNLEVVATVPGTLVYDLIWSGKNTTSDVIEFRKWRVFVDEDTDLPKKTEQYVKLKAEDEYKFEKADVVTYPSGDQIQALIRETFGPAAIQLSEPEYMGTPGAN